MPGVRVATIADSAALLGGMVVASISLCWAACQLSFSRTSAPFASRNSSVGSWSAPVMPALASEGPIARNQDARVRAAIAACDHPPIMTLSPESTKPRVAMLASFEFAA